MGATSVSGMDQAIVEGMAFESAIKFATETFGWTGWSSKYFEVTVVYEEMQDNLCSVSAHSIVEVKVNDGCHVSVTDQPINMQSEAQVYEKAIKRASTDGLCMALGVGVD
ncbi:DNA repair protein rad52 [Branchiostoma belcheri]|nr:DNA repair protein rad52 [Branchiostoma belcheri]